MKSGGGVLEETVAGREELKVDAAALRVVKGSQLAPLTLAWYLNPLSTKPQFTATVTLET